MRYESNRPIYLQVMDSLKKKMVTGDIAVGDKLPSTRALAIDYDINPNTAARVYKELEAEGICYTKRGEGTFVTDDAGLIRRILEEEATAVTRRFISEMHGLGLDVKAMVQKIKDEEDSFDDSIENRKTN